MNYSATVLLQNLGYQDINYFKSGATSDIFVATNTEGDAKVALKVLKLYLKDQPEIIRRFQKEARIIERFSGDSIVTSKDFFFLDDGRPVLVQEFVEGPTLGEMIDGFIPKSFPLLAIIMVADILHALEEPHQRKIIHRDLKPQNILVTGKGKIKITDFGIAKQIQSQTTHLTTSIIGSPSYMSPEQARGENSIDQRSDIFSVGIILYQMCTNQLPFQGETYGEVIYKIINGALIDANKINPYVGVRLNNIIKKSLEKNADNRYQFVHEMRSDLLKLMYDFSLHASGNELLESYMFKQGPFEGSSESMNGFVSTELTEQLKIKKTKLQQINLCSQILEIDPTNDKALKTLHKLTSKRKIGYYWLLLLFIPFGFFLKPSQTEQILPSPKVVTTIAPIKVVPVVKEKTELKIIPKLVSPPKIKTFLKFITDQDVFVFVDGKEITPNSEGKVEVSAGPHWIKLVKNNFLPIEAKVDAKKGETTIINTKGSSL